MFENYNKYIIRKTPSGVHIAKLTRKMINGIVKIAVFERMENGGRKTAKIHKMLISQ